MSRVRRKFFIVFTLLLLLAGLSAWWLNQAVQQDRENAALIAAIRKNDTAAALQALERGADANARDLGDTKPSIGRHLRQLWDRLRDHSQATEEAWRPTALQILFARKGNEIDGFVPPQENVAVLQALLECGANPHVVGKEGMTPLHHAVFWDFDNSVALLLRNGASVHARDVKGQTPLLSSLEDNLHIFRLLLEAGADPNAVDAAGRSPLLNSASVDDDEEGYEKVDAARLLLAHGADVDHQNREGSTALMWATERGNKSLVKLLLEYHASVNLRDKKGVTALSLVRYRQELPPATRDEIIRLLKQAGAK